VCGKTWAHVAAVIKYQSYDLIKVAICSADATFAIEWLTLRLVTNKNLSTEYPH